MFLTRLALLLIAISFAPHVSAETTIDQFKNPLDVSIADPQVLEDNGTYYLYGTTYEPNGFAVYTSEDMVHWSRRGMCWETTATAWAQLDFWAPEVIKAGGKYYLYYTARNYFNGPLNVCVASSDSPLGPFTDVNSPLLPETESYLDGNPYYDPVSKKHYLFAVREDIWPNSIVVTELTDPPTSHTGPITPVLSPTQEWEDNWVEAPYVIRHKDTYYMMYSGKAFWKKGYAIGYATATSLQGPWTKYVFNPIISRTETTVSGPGHNSVAYSPDGSELFTLYHTHLNFEGGGSRQLAIDRLQFISSSTSGQPDHLQLESGYPTTSLQPLPSSAKPRSVGSSDNFDSGTLDRDKWLIFREYEDEWDIKHGQLHIDTRPGDIHQSSLLARNIFLQYAPSGDFDFDTRVDFTPMANFEQAFLILWENQSNFIRFSTVYADEPSIEIGVEIDGYYSGTLYQNPWGQYLRLRIQRRGDQYTMYAGNPTGSGWTQLGPAVTFQAVQPKVGIGAISSISSATRTARFDYFNITVSSGVNDWSLY